MADKHLIVVLLLCVPGAHAPSKPEVFVLGRKELQVSWKSPEVPLGRISRYDLSVNGEVVYSGTDLYYSVRRLKPDTEYIFMVRQKRLVEKKQCKNNKKSVRIHVNVLFIL